MDKTQTRGGHLFWLEGHFRNFVDLFQARGGVGSADEVPRPICPAPTNGDTIWSGQAGSSWRPAGTPVGRACSVG